MPKHGRTAAVKEPAAELPEIEMDIEASGKGFPAKRAPIENFLRRKAEVGEKDREEFQEYLNEKSKRASAAADAAPEKPKPWLNRRTVLRVAAGTAVAGEAAALGYSMIQGGAVSEQGLKHGGATYTEAQRHHIVRELIDTKADVGGRSLGKWIALLPTKLGGGTYALDLNSNRVLASIWYWNYGDFNPISHHLCAFPSSDPYHGFEFVNSTQGGKNSLIYGIPTRITTPAEGFNIYRVRYDGSQMQLVENVSETTGLGLGVHVCINPKDAQSYFVTDGQKDVAACFDRTTSQVIAALRFDWEPNVGDLAQCWQKGGTLKISRIYPDPTTGKYDYEGTKGQKIEWEMVPMGELFVEEGAIPGDDPHSLTGADGTIWHPSGRWAATVTVVRRDRDPRCRGPVHAGRLRAVQQGFA
jgi:hypothetical protein